MYYITCLDKYKQKNIKIHMDYVYAKQINEYRTKQAKKANRKAFLANLIAGCLLLVVSLIACCVESLV